MSSRVVAGASAIALAAIVTVTPPASAQGTGGALEHAQEMAAHESPRTTKLYDRTKEERLTQDEVERDQAVRPEPPRQLGFAGDGCSPRLSGKSQRSDRLPCFSAST